MLILLSHLLLFYLLSHLPLLIYYLLPLLSHLLLSLKGPFVLGEALSYADLALLDFEAWLPRTIPDIKLPEKLKAVVLKVEADPQVAAYLARRPKTNF